MGGANQRGDALTKAVQRAGGSHDPRCGAPPLPHALGPPPPENGGSLMCGIFGYVKAEAHGTGDAAGIVLRGLKKLEYRGYDSWGVAVAHGGRAALERRVGKIGEAETSLPASAAG